MANKKLFAVSILLNVAFAVVVAMQFARRDEPVAQSPPPAGIPPATLRSATAPEQEKILALATLEADARAANPPPRLEFWKSGDEAAMDAYLQKVDEQLDSMRRTLTARYGSGAADDPLFARLFKPLNARFPYLSSKSQLALARLQRSVRPGPIPASAASPVDPTGALQREQAFTRALREVFGTEEFDQYLMHESFAARQLRGSGVAADEQEFREVFAVLQQMNSDPSANGYLAGQDKLREMLGPQRYIRYSAARDPQFVALENAAMKHQLTREQTLAAYGLVLDAQMELVRASVERQAGQVRSGPEPQKVFEERDLKVASLVGDEAAADLVRAYSNGVIAASLAMSNNSAR